MRRLLWSCLLLVGWAAVAQDVQFADTNLEWAVRTALGQPTGPLTTNDLQLLTSLDAPALGIRSVAGLEAATRLGRLNLTNNVIDDLSPLAGLVGLTNLDLSFNAITNPAVLSGLTNLTGLGLNRYRPSFYPYVPPLAHLGTPSWLSNLQALVHLGFAGNGVTNAGPLGQLTRLQYLDLSSNPVMDISPLAGLYGLTALDLSRDSVTNFAVLGGLTNMVRLNLNSGYPQQPGYPTMTAGLLGPWPAHALGTPSWLSNLQGLVELDLVGTGVTNVAPLRDRGRG